MSSGQGSIASNKNQFTEGKVVTSGAVRDEGSVKLSKGQDSVDVHNWVIERPQIQDATGIFQLVCDTGVLDVNSRYAYLMWCERFSQTSFVVRSQAVPDSNAESTQPWVLGFVLGMVPPAQSETIFVWQIAISASLRGQGLGQQLLQRLVSQQVTEVNYLEAHVGESNEASARLFASFARQANAELHVGPGLGRELFGDGDHESERLFRIGPLNRT